MQNIIIHTTYAALNLQPNFMTDTITTFMHTTHYGNNLYNVRL